MTIPTWICFLVLACLSVYSKADVVRAEFQSCPACRLNALPQVKRFLYKVVNQGDYPNVSVKWLHGRTPELVLYDENDKEVERMYVDKLTFNDLHTLLQQKGFKPKSDSNEESSSDSKEKPQLTTVLQQPTGEAESSASNPEQIARRALRGLSNTNWLQTLSSASLARSLDLDA